MYALDLICFEPVFRFSRGAMRGFAEAPGAVTVDVAPEWRRRGLARQLMAEVETKLHSAGAEKMELHVFTGNAEAIRFYQSIGYAPLGETKDFYAQSLHALLYRKRLPA